MICSYVAVDHGKLVTMTIPMPCNDIYVETSTRPLHKLILSYQERGPLEEEHNNNQHVFVVSQNNHYFLTTCEPQNN